MGDGDLFTVDLDGVAGVDLCPRFGDELAVDGDLALFDEFGGVTTGADTGVSDVFV